MEIEVTKTEVRKESWEPADMFCPKCGEKKALQQDIERLAKLRGIPNASIITDQMLRESIESQPKP